MKPVYSLPYRIAGAVCLVLGWVAAADIVLQLLQHRISFNLLVFLIPVGKRFLKNSEDKILNSKVHSTDLYAILPLILGGLAFVATLVYPPWALYTRGPGGAARQFIGHHPFNWQHPTEISAQSFLLGPNWLYDFDVWTLEWEWIAIGFVSSVAYMLVRHWQRSRMPVVAMA